MQAVSPPGDSLLEFHKRKRKPVGHDSSLKKPRLSLDRMINGPPSPPHSASVSAGRYSSNCSDTDEYQVAASPVARMRRNSGRKQMLGQHPGLGPRRRKSAVVPECDLAARQRCVDYLVTAIDEVWARYCCQTANAESERYSEGNCSSQYVEIDLPSSPLSLCDEGEENEDAQYLSGKGSGSITICQPRSGRVESISEHPSSRALMALRQRLLNAKYFFLELIDNNDASSCAAFWHRWDLVKYAAIELVEEDGDDDDVVESVTETLEDGRFYGSRV